MTSIEENVKSLKGTLASLAKLFEYTRTDSNKAIINDLVMQLLYFTATNGGKHLHDLFPNKNNFPDNVSEILRGATAAGPFPKIADKFYVDGKEGKLSDINPIHTGRPCSKKFKKGEPIYRCHDCGFDDTCVLCTYCFNKKEHEGHQVYVSIASASNEGICDCGDPEAWTRELHCNCEYQNTGKKSKRDVVVEDDLKMSIKATIDLVLNFIIEVMIHTNHTLPEVHKNLKSSSTLKGLTIDFSDDASFQDVEDQNNRSFCLILWNDEFHNYREANDRIQAVLECDEGLAHRVALNVDKEGRALLKNETDIDSIIDSYYIVQRNGLTATIHSSRDYFKQELIKDIVDWLTQFINFPIFEIQSVIRQIFCESMTEAFDTTNTVVPTYLSSISFNLSKEKECFERGLLTDQNKIPRGGLTKFSKDEYAVGDLKNAIDKLLVADDKPLANSRLQYLMYFDVRYWKSLRKAIHNIITPVLVSNLSYKPVFAEQFVEIYPHLLNNRAYLDREWLLNIIQDTTVQLFTCPKTSLNILVNGNLGSILGPVIQLFEKNRSITENNDIIWRRRPILSPSDNISRSIMATESRSLSDIVQLIECPNINSFKEEHLCILKNQNLALLILLLEKFQSNWKIKRKEGEHVLTESTEFTVYFELNSILYSLVKKIGQILLKVNKENETSKQIVTNSIILLNNFLQLNYRKEKIIEQGDFTVMDFVVAKEEVGFMNPVNSLLSYVLEYSKWTDTAILNDKIISFSLQRNEVRHHDNNICDFLRISDISLRAIVLCSQIKSGFWVRNGMLVGKQEALYTGSFMSEGGFLRDIHLEQCSIMVEPSLKRSLFNFLDRFDLLNWFLNKEQIEETKYDEKVYYIIEELIIFFYDLLTNRLPFRYELTEEQKEELKIKNLISFSLCREPLTYSKLTENFPPMALEHPKFYDILQEVSDFSPPRGLSDSGLYRLKDWVYKTLDPLSAFVDSSDFQETANAIRTELSNHSHVKADDIVLQPRIAKLEYPGVFENFERVSKFFKTMQFAKLLYKLLQVSVDTDNEGFLPNLLHLVHAIILDDEISNGKNHQLQSIIEIPICNLLLMIIESQSISQSNIKKAEVILDLLFQKDETIIESSLIDCFGEEHIKSYRKSKPKNGEASESREEKRKRLAQHRRAKIMKKFEEQQRQFANKNKKLLSPESPESSKERNNNAIDKEGDSIMKDESEADESSEIRTCILCQMPENNEELFGLPCFINKSSIFWKVPLNDSAAIKLNFNEWNNQNAINDDEINHGRRVFDEINNKKRKRIDSRESHAEALFHHEASNPTESPIEEHQDNNIEDEGFHDALEHVESDYDDVINAYDDIIVDEIEYNNNDSENDTPMGEGIDIEIDHDREEGHSVEDVQEDYQNHTQQGQSETTDGSNISKEFGKSVDKRYVISTCGHGMHYKCFNQYVKTAISYTVGYQCPLCRTLSNSFIPSFIKPSLPKEFEIEGEPISSKYNQIVVQKNGKNTEKICSLFINEQFLQNLIRPSAIKDKLLKDLCLTIKENQILEKIYSDKTNYFSNIQSLSILIGNTIQVHEITSRFLSKDEDFNEVEISKTDNTLLTSLIQFRTLLTCCKKELVKATVTELMEYEVLWKEKFLHVGLFTELIMLSFQCDESLQTLIQFNVTKNFTIILTSLLDRCQKDDGSITILICANGDEYDCKEDLTFLQTLIVEKFFENKNEYLPELITCIKSYKFNNVQKSKNSFLVGLYLAIIRSMLPFYRQLYSFIRLLKPSFKIKSNDNNHLKNKNDLIISQMKEISSYLKIGTLCELSETILSNESKLEFNVFDNVLHSKIPKFRANGILTLEYSGVIRLIDLPMQLDKFLEVPPAVLKKTDSRATDSGATVSTSSVTSNAEGSLSYTSNPINLQYSICLLCGNKVDLNTPSTLTDQLIRHFLLDCEKSARLLSIFFNPFKNIIVVILKFNSSTNLVSKFLLPSPYLNRHGESNFRRGEFNGLLNVKRFHELNKMWLNQGLYAFLSRTAICSRNVLQGGGINMEQLPNDEFDMLTDQEVGFMEW
ncbi:hypothetical protein PACTADRAFT_50235 [Pachysolen tannophilus NRRL Y-2460]|uniref:E3 ubiquitin-protein ligase n=1 Tax=Pachysolen tannophilus NRRL Y-2460 TaxID=669874 RepID=A0A1E4TUV1_PACTA|nr:hypothetical protein PACTADRAFT_50235 [Pachysolen tannophilus NRRL Y-2460]